MSKTAAEGSIATHLASYLVDKQGMSKEAADKVAAGITVYLLEELGDARLRCAQLKKYVKQATDLIEKSSHKDHFFEVAAHLIHGIPDTLFKLEKALDASALAAARMDYEEIKDTLKPEKADELDDVLQDVRLRYLQRRSGGDAPDQTNGKGTSMTPKEAAEQFLAIANETEQTGRIPLNKVMVMLAKLEGQGKRASVEPAKAASVFRQIAADINAPSETKPSRLAIASFLRNVIADQMQPTSAQVAATIYQTANSREDVMKGFKDANPSMSDEDLQKAADMWEKNKNVVKEKH